MLTLRSTSPIAASRGLSCAVSWRWMSARWTVKI
jgi:hypothetical protein